jgi:hypothetical protein
VSSPTLSNHGPRNVVSSAFGAASLLLRSGARREDQTGTESVASKPRCPSSPTHPSRYGGARRHGQIHHVFLPSMLEVPHLVATRSNCITLDCARSNPLPTSPLPVGPRAPRCAAGRQATERMRTVVRMRMLRPG